MTPVEQFTAEAAYARAVRCVGLANFEATGEIRHLIPMLVYVVEIGKHIARRAEGRT